MNKHEREVHEQEVYDWLRRDVELTIAFDTSAIFANRSLMKLCNKINSLKVSGNKKIELVVPAPAYLEKLHDLKQQHQDNYDLGTIISGLKLKGLTVTAFELRHAEIVAELIGKQFPTTKDWQDFKRDRCINCLRLKGKIVKLGRRKTCGATVDWLIAGYAYAEKNCLLVTGDKGEEFKDIRKTNLESLIAVVEQLLKETEVKTVVKP